MGLLAAQWVVMIEVGDGTQVVAAGLTWFLCYIVEVYLNYSDK